MGLDHCVHRLFSWGLQQAKAESQKMQMWPGGSHPVLTLSHMDAVELVCN